MALSMKIIAKVTCYGQIISNSLRIRLFNSAPYFSLWKGWPAKPVKQEDHYLDLDVPFLFRYFFGKGTAFATEEELKALELLMAREGNSAAGNEI